VAKMAVRVNLTHITKAKYDKAILICESKLAVSLFDVPLQMAKALLNTATITRMVKDLDLCPTPDTVAKILKQVKSVCRIGAQIFMLVVFS